MYIGSKYKRKSMNRWGLTANQKVNNITIGVKRQPK